MNLLGVESTQQRGREAAAFRDLLRDRKSRTSELPVLR